MTTEQVADFITIRKVLALRGPNYWTNRTCLEAWVDLGPYKDISSEMMPGFNERLTSLLPTMIEHRCSVGERGGFFQRLQRGTYLAHILEHVTLELQTLAGTPVGFGRARETSEEGVYKVAVAYKEEELGKAALETAYRLLRACVKSEPFDIAGEVKLLRELAYEVCLGPSTNAIVQAAAKRGIPFRRLNKGSLVQLGYGCKQRRILTAETDRTSAIAESIAQDKELTRSLLQSVGVPVPNGRPVDDAEDAWEAAQEIGLPVVVKPQYGNQGRGVATNLTTREQVVLAYANAKEQGNSIIVERYMPGDDYRVLVIGDRVVAAARREPANVTGDGHSTIRQLVDMVNSDPRRSDDHATALTKIKLEEIAISVLAEQGLSPNSVPTAGRKVLIRRNANLSTGGTATDVTDFVHPEVASVCIEAARVIGLDIAGVDVVCNDISKSLEEQGGGIVEVNAGPGLRMHLEPSTGSPRPVGEAIIDMMFPEGQNGRIPVVAVSGTNGKTTTTRLMAHLFRTTGRRVGMTCTDGIYIGSHRVDNGDCSGPSSAKMVLMNPMVDAAVLETARGGILRAGLGFDLCDVAIVTNIGEGDHLGLADIDDLEKLARVKRCIVDVVMPQGYAVLKADDPHTAAMAEKCKGGVIFFARRGDHAVIQEHRKKGGRAVFVKAGTIMLAEGEVEIPLVQLEKVPLTHGGKIAFQVENVLACAAGGWGMGLTREVIRSGLESFAADMEKVPGRFNLIEFNGAAVVVDYGHNVSSLQAMIDTLEQFPHQRRLAVYSAAGDRRDEDMVRQGEMLGEFFDHVHLYEDHYLRGRQPGDIIRLFESGITKGQRTKEVQKHQGSLVAVQAALERLQPGDLLLCQADVIDETCDYIRTFIKEAGTAREVALTDAINTSVAHREEVSAHVTD
jgi:cyanophycin synthetase